MAAAPAAAADADADAPRGPERVAELLLAGFVALVGFVVARTGGASLSGALVYALVVLTAAVLIAEFKNRLAGH